MSITKGEHISESALVKLIVPILGGAIAIGAAALGLVPLWAIAALAAGGLLAWGVIEYLSDRPMRA